MNQKRKYKTKLGGLFTFIMIGLCVLLFINFGSDMMNHNNPTSLYAEVFKLFPEETYFSREKYFFMFGIQRPNFSHFIDETYYKTSVVNARVSLTGESTFTPVPIERCSEAHLPSNPNLFNYFLNAGRSSVKDLYCIKQGTDNEFKVSGSFDVDLYEFIDINIETCKNSTDPTTPVCKPVDVINEALSGYFAFYYTDYLIDPEDFDNPGKAIGKDYFSPISVGVIRNNNRYISTTRIFSDDGFLFSQKNEYIYPTFKQDKETFLIDSTNSGKLVSMRLRKHHNEQIYNRRYKKIQNVLSEMGGFIQILYLLFFAITYPFVYKNYYEKIINTIYNFEIVSGEKENNLSTTNSKHERKINSKNSDKKNDISNLKRRITPWKVISNWPPSSPPLDNDLNNPNNVLDKKLEFGGFPNKNNNFVKYMIKLQNRPPLRSSFCGFFCNKLKRFFFRIEDEEDLKFKQLDLGIRSISSRLDISYILKKFYEVDKLKMLLLDRNQYHLFEYLPKPVIKKNNQIELSSISSILNGTGENQNFVAEEGDYASKTKRMYDAYHSILMKKELSEMDQKLIDLLDDNIKTFLKVFKLLI